MQILSCLGFLSRKPQKDLNLIVPSSEQPVPEFAARCLWQECGDILFVPEGWGHATILDSYAVA